MHGSRVDPPQSTVADHDPGRPVPFDWPNPGPSFGARARDLRQPDYSPLPGEGYRVPGTSNGAMFRVSRPLRVESIAGRGHADAAGGMW